MTHYLTVDASPIDGCDVAVKMGGTDRDIPIVTVVEGVRVTLGNHDDPATWLRTTAERLIDLAEQVEAHAIAEAQ